MDAPDIFASQSWTRPDGSVITSRTCDAQGRIAIVRRCSDVAGLRAALAEPGMQGTVRKAIEVRLRKLERAA